MPEHARPPIGFGARCCEHCGVTVNHLPLRLIESYPVARYEYLCQACILLQDSSFTATAALDQVQILIGSTQYLLSLRDNKGMR